MNVASVILAAGEGTRMKSKLPKVLHPLAGQPLVMYLVNLTLQVSNQPPVMVVGTGAKLVRNRVGDDCVRYVLQEQRLGTGHAVLQARDELRGRSDAVLVLYGDMPLLTPPTITSLLNAFAVASPAVAMLTLEIAPGAPSMGFGRVLRNGEGQVTEIVEESVATPEQLELRELNCGVYCFRAPWLWDRLTHLQLRRKGEYFLTDLIGMAVSEGERVVTVPVEDPDDVLGINDRLQLARAEAVMRRRVNAELMRAGVTLTDPQTTYVDVGVRIAPDTVIHPNTYLQGNVDISDDCIIGPNAMLRNTTVGPRCRIYNSVLEGASLGADVTIGPFGHLRSGARLDNGVHMGNFGEVKNSYLGPGTKMGHFSYIGDSTLGPDVNVGAGTVTCNYDGERKHATRVGEGTFIGSGSMLVAPLEIGPGAKIGAGSVVTHDVPANALAYGVPARQRGMVRSARVDVQPEEAQTEEERVAQERPE